MFQQQPQQPQTNQQLNNSIAYARQMMQMIQNASNPQAELSKFIQNNPNSAAIASMLKSGANLETIAKNMAQQYGIDINDLINQITPGQR